MKTLLLKNARGVSRTVSAQWNEKIEPWIGWVHERHGAMARIARMMQDKYGVKVARQQVHGWLHKDVAMRIEPKAGMAFVLLDVLKAVKAEYDAS